MHNSNDNGLGKNYLMRILFLIFFFIFSTYHVCPTNAFVTLDPDNISPSTFENLIKEAKAKEDSFSKVGYYIPGNEKIEFRVILNPSEEGVGDFEWLNDYEKNSLPVSKKAEIDSTDIEGILIQKSTYSGRKEYRAIIYFRESSWDKVHNVTERLAKKIDRMCAGEKLALIKGESIVSAPMVCDAITESVRIGIPGGPSHIDFFLENLLLADEPAAEKRTKAYIEWLEKRVKNIPNDFDSMQMLLNLYYENKLTDCEKEYSLLERLIMRSPSKNLGYIERLHSCYLSLKKYDSAIQTFETAAQRDRDFEWLIRGFLADIYYAKGNREKALAEFKRSLVLTNSQTLPQFFDYIPDSLEKRKMLDDFNRVKAKIRKSLENRIKEIETEAKSDSSN